MRPDPDLRPQPDQPPTATQNGPLENHEDSKISPGGADLADRIESGPDTPENLDRFPPCSHKFTPPAQSLAASIVHRYWNVKAEL